MGYARRAVRGPIGRVSTGGSVPVGPLDPCRPAARGTGRRARETGEPAILPGQAGASSATISENAAVWQSTSASVVSGDMSAMLWNGVSRMPRLRAARWR
jgi:hypothetical protein